MVRCSDYHGVDALLLIQHLAKILITLRTRILIESFGCEVGIHIAQSNDVFAADLFQVRGALAANADSRDVEFAVGRRLACSPQNSRCEDHKSGSGGCGTAKETSAGDSN